MFGNRKSESGIMISRTFAWLTTLLTFLILLLLLSRCASKRIEILPSSKQIYIVQQLDDRIAYCIYRGVDTKPECFVDLKEHKLIGIEPGYWKEIVESIEWCKAMEFTDEQNVGQ